MRPSLREKTSPCSMRVVQKTLKLRNVKSPLKCFESTSASQRQTWQNTQPSPHNRNSTIEKNRQERQVSTIKTHHFLPLKFLFFGWPSLPSHGTPGRVFFFNVGSAPRKCTESPTESQRLWALHLGDLKVFSLVQRMHLGSGRIPAEVKDLLVVGFFGVEKIPTKTKVFGRLGNWNILMFEQWKVDRFIRDQIRLICHPK